MPGSKYARGTRAWGLCQKCGLRFLLRDLVFDGYYPGLRVCSGCYDDKQPQEFLIDVTDPIALWRPSPEFGPKPSVLSGYGISDKIFLTWTETTPRGGARVSSYSIFRAVSSDPTSFPPPSFLAILPVEYYGDPGETDLADLVENGSSRAAVLPGDDNEGIESETLQYEDDTATDFTLFYQYVIVATMATTSQGEFQSVRSNVVVLQPTFYHFLDPMHASSTVLAGTLVAGLFFSSRPYPVQVIEFMHAHGIPLHTPAYQGPGEPFHGSADFLAGTLDLVLVQYLNWPLLVADEQFHASSDLLAGTLLDALIVYDNWPLAVADEQFHASSDMLAGTVFTALIQYTNWPLDVADEQFHSSADFLAGTLA